MITARTALRILLSLSVVSAAMATNVGSAAACGEVKHSRAHRTPSVAGRPPLLIGDSTSILAAPKLARLGIEADAHGCRQFSQGLQIISSRRHSHRLPHVVILALGANGPIRYAQISRALRIVGRGRVLALVTPPKAGASASAMRREARRRPNRVLLIEWAGISSHHGGWFDGDGLHPGYPGAGAFARIIKRAVAPFAFPPVRRLHLPRTAKKSKDCGVISRGGYRLRVFLVRGDDRSTCAGAIAVARRPALRRDSRWRSFDLRAAKAGPWQWARTNPKRGALIALTE